MDVRRKIYQELVNSPQVTSLVVDRVFQANMNFTPPKEKPFLVYRMFPQTVKNYVLGASDAFFQVWAHDDPGDYHTIDVLLGYVREALLRASPESGFLEFRFNETSADYEDTYMATITRYCRYQAVLLDPLPEPIP